MASQYKPKITTYQLPDGKHRTSDGKRVTKNTPGAVKVSRKSEIWYGKYSAADGIVGVPLCTDKTASKQMLAKLVIDTKMGQLGMADPYAAHRLRPLPEHLADFRRALDAKGNTPEYVALVSGRLEALANGCGW